MSRPIQRNSTGILARVRIFDEDAMPWTGVAHDAAGLQIWYTPLGGSPVQITLSSGNWTEKKHGWYEVAVPDAAYTGTVPLQFSGEITDGTVEGPEHVIVGYDPLAKAVGAATTAQADVIADDAAAARVAAEAAAALLDALTELDDDQLRLTAEALEAADVDLQPVLDAVGLLTGPAVRTLTVVAHTGEDPEPGEPVAGLQIRVAGRTITTDTAGLAEIRLNPGTYAARMIAPVGFQPVAPLEITIGADDVVLTVGLVASALPSEAAPYCLTRFAVQDQFTDAAEGATIEVAFVRFLPGATRTAVVISPDSPLVTGPGGYVDRRLNRLAEYDVTYRVPGSLPKKLRVRTPDAGSLLVVEP